MNNFTRVKAILEGKDYDNFFKVYGNMELTMPLNKKLLQICNDLKQDKVITSEQFDSISSTLRAAQSRNDEIKLGNVLNKIYDNDKAVLLIRKGLVG